MERPLTVPPHVVRHHIARTQLGDSTTLPTRIGTITLHPHQISALHRIHSAITRFHGALLCDDVGLGKTYVALAIASRYKAPLIITPPTLRATWTAAMHATKVHAQWLSLHALSHTKPTIHPYDFIVVDEAHHARTPTTKRNAALAQLCATAPVLLLTATPIHNTTNDLTTLVALFLGTHANALTPQRLTQLVIRRTANQIPTPLARPTISATRWIATPHTPEIGQAIIDLPPPIPIHHTNTAPALVTLNLLRQWTSSDAALKHALTRRIARASALLDALEAGYIPTQRDIDTWQIDDNAIQLTFPELMPTAPPQPETLASTIRTHTHALQSLLAQLPRHSPNDVKRADIIRMIRLRHPNQRIIAFSQYAQTIRALFRELRHDHHVAAITATSAHIASGPVTRQHILDRFTQSTKSAFHPPHHTNVTLLLTTDLLSEGVNLQTASVLIHLDLPWTPATLHQRIGRLARIGTTHPTITIYGFHIPPLPDQYIRLMTTLRTKADTTRTVLGKNGLRQTVARPNDLPHPLELSEHVHRTLVEWDASSPRHHERVSRGTLESASANHTMCATIHATRTENVGTTLLAACKYGNESLLVTGPINGPLTDHPTAIATIIQHSNGQERAHQVNAYHQALRTIHHWWSTRQARLDIGLPDEPHANPHTTRLVQHLASLTQHLPSIQRSHIATTATHLIQSTNQNHPIHLERQWKQYTKHFIERVKDHATHEASPSSQLSHHKHTIAHPLTTFHVVALLLLHPHDNASDPPTTSLVSNHTPARAIPQSRQRHRLARHTPHDRTPRRHPPPPTQRRLPSGVCLNVPSPSSSIWTAP